MPRLQRTKGLHWLLALDHVLRVVVGLGLLQFMLEGEDHAGTVLRLSGRPRDVIQRPLVISSDQGGGGWQSLFFAQYLLGL